MLHFLPAPVNGALSLILLSFNTVACCLPLFLVAFLKLAVPSRPWRKCCDVVLNGIAEGWILGNNLSLKLTKKIHWDVKGLEGLKRNGWYLVLANHQTWTDIVVLQKIFWRKIPFLKFFLKKELIYVPFLGLAWWALDFPFMERRPRGMASRRSRARGGDPAATVKACEKFKTIPISVMNFVEGTRFTPEKRDGQRSPFQHLLRPKAAGIAIVLASMGEQIHQILDVTIAYPEGVKSFWAFLCGRVTRVKVRVRTLPITSELLGDYFEDREFRARFHDWLNRLWEEKDGRIAALLAGAEAGCDPVALEGAA